MSFWKDIVFGLRMQFKAPAVTFAVVLTLGLGIAATGVAFSLVNSFFLRPLPIDEPERLVRIYSDYASGRQYFTISYPDYADMCRLSGVFSGVLVDKPTAVNVGSAAGNERIWGSRVSANYFALLGVRPAFGRLFSENETEPGWNDTAVVLSYGFWQRHFGATPAIVGQSITLNGEPHNVVGVAPRDFHGINLGVSPDLWLPIGREEQLRQLGVANRGARGYFAMGRLQPGVTLDQSRAALDTLARRLQELYPATNQGIRFSALPESEGRVHPLARGSVLGVSGVLVGVAVLLLSLACSNVAGILLVRAASRAREVGVRLAMGATRRRIVRQLLTEAALSSLVAGGFGLALAWTISGLLSAVQVPTRIPLHVDFSVDARVLVFSVLITVVACLVCGLAPALDASRSDLISVLKDGEATFRLRRSRLRNGLVAAQVALSTILLIGGGLFLRSLQNAQRVDLGFEPRHVVMTSLDLGLQGYQADQAAVFWRKLVDRIAALPRTESVSLASNVPFELNITTISIAPEGYQAPPDNGWPSIDIATVDCNYFATVGTPLLEGREFGERDTRMSPPVVVVNEELVRRFWPRRSGLAMRVMTRAGEMYEVVGVVKTAKHLTLGEAPKPFVYFPVRQSEARALTVLARGKGDPTTYLREVRDAVHAIDSNVPLYNVTTMSEHVDAALAPARSGAMVLSLVGLVALVLATVGLYGTMAHVVSRRTHEIGVRRALGAQDGDVIRLVMRQAMFLVLLGLAAGMIVSFAGSRLLTSVLYGARGSDLVVFGVAPLALLLVCAIAAAVPGYRAIRIDAGSALHHE